MAGYKRTEGWKNRVRPSEDGCSIWIQASFAEGCRLTSLGGALPNPDVQIEKYRKLVTCI